MATKQANAYSESSIRVLKGLEPVQQRPGMYTRTDNPLHVIQEVLDNSADEALAGYGRKLKVTLHTDGSGERRATSARRVPTHDALPPPPPPLTAPPPRLSAPAAAVAVEVRHSGSQELHQRIKRNQWGSFFQARAWGGGGMGARAGGRTARRRGVHMRRPAPPLLPANTPQCPCHLSDLPAQQVGRQLEEEGSRGRCRSSSCRRADLVARAALPRALPLAHHPFIPSHLLRSAHCHLPRLLCHPPPPPFRRPTHPAPPPRGRAPAQRHVTTI